MLVLDLHLAVPALDKIRDEIHRAGAVECHQRGDVLHGSELEFAAQIAHAAGFQLEHPDGAAFVEQIVSLLVIEWEKIHVDGLALGGLDHLAGVADDRQRFQAEKIHLQQAQIAHGVHGVLGGDDAVGVRLEREHINQRLGADHHCRGVDGGIACEILQHKRGINQLACDFLVIVGLFEFGGLFERFFQRDLEFVRDHLG